MRAVLCVNVRLLSTTGHAQQNRFFVCRRLIISKVGHGVRGISYHFSVDLQSILLQYDYELYIYSHIGRIS